MLGRRNALLVVWFALFCVGCPSVDDNPEPEPIPEPEPEEDAGPIPTSDGGSVVWPAVVTVEVRDPTGAPVDAAYVMMGGATVEAWVLTDAAGGADILVDKPEGGDFYLLAGKEGWFSGGTSMRGVDPIEDVVEIQLKPLPSEDNPSYAFQPGGNGTSPDSSECGHCHNTIADDWAGSAHSRAASSPQLWDLYTGSALAFQEENACSEAGGWMGAGQTPGALGETQNRCYVGQGVLPWLHTICGGPAEPACDHPDQRSDLAHFGHCADCHSPAVKGGVPGEIHLGDAIGVAFEGVTCDFCHKVAAVTADGSPGLAGGISLLRPSETTVIPGQEFDPIIFGPYPDVIVPIMNGVYTPQFRSADWCASCHEYTQPALHPDESELLDGDRWPAGLPIMETWSEFSVYAGGASEFGCRDCHMLPLDEESSTYNITDKGLTAAVDQGWFRPLGEVRHHDFPGAPFIGDPDLAMEVVEQGGALEVQVSVANFYAGHAAPTGEPLKQILITVEAENAAFDKVPALGGQVIGDVGGYVFAGTVGLEVSITDSQVEFVDVTLAAGTPYSIRVVRPSGDWVDYAGPGTSYFSEATLTAADKGIPAAEFLGESALNSCMPVAAGNGDGDGGVGPPVDAGDDDGDAGVGPDTICTLESALPPTQMGDRVYVVKENLWAGASGWLYAKVLVDADGQRGVAHYRAVDIVSDNRIAAGQTSSSMHRFPLPQAGDTLTITARMIRRSYGFPTATTYGWDFGDRIARTVEETYAP